MKKAFPIIVILIIFAAIVAALMLLVPAIRYGAFGVNLQYGFKPGSSEKYTEKTDVSFKGKASESTAKGFDLTSEKSLNVETTKADKDSAFVMMTSQIISRGASLDNKVKTAIPGSGDKSSLSVKVTPQGNILDLEAPRISPDKREKAIKLYQFFTGFIMLPEKSIRPGQTWEQPVDADFEQDYLGLNTPIKGNITHKLVKLENYNGVMAAVIESTGTFNTQSSLVKNKLVSMDAVITVKGSFYFDIAKGMPLHSEREINIELNKTVPVINVKVKAGSTIKTVMDKQK
ncbi:MAG: hypothetical protein LWY06_14020 [Firmicutes bacterium]|nr:hypothetical protein [Bacillota bacterium]